MGWIGCPELNLKFTLSGCAAAGTAVISSNAAPIKTRRSGYVRMIGSSVCRLRALCRFALRELFLVLFVRQVVPADPGERHLVDRPRTVPDPVLGIRIELVGGGVVPPTDDMQECVGGNDRRRLIVIIVHGVPVVIPCDACDR